MNLIKFNRRDDDMFPHFRSLVDDFFGDNFFRSMSTGTTLPAANIKNDEKEVGIELAVPGFKKEDLKIDLKDNVLTVSSEKRDEHEENKKNFSRREYSYSSFSRSFTLPENISKEDIQAECRDGVLQITIPKKGLPTKTSRQIEIK